jgi:hypothetical protein
MLEDTKSYVPSEMGSMKVRDIGVHPKGNYRILNNLNYIFMIDLILTCKNRFQEPMGCHDRTASRG